MFTLLGVALRKESVDRNPYIPLAKVRHCEVALRKESVDRNAIVNIAIFFFTVALRKESVDRNFGPPALSGPRAQSLSARRAWIEISTFLLFQLSSQRRSPQGERG
mgnify:CR=1 FL=1